MLAHLLPLLLTSSGPPMGMDTPPHPQFNTAVFVLGLVFVVVASLAAFIQERMFLSESLVALGVGVVLGPGVLGVLRPSEWGEELQFTLLEQLTRFAIGLQVVGLLMQAPRGFPSRQWRSLLMMLGPVMVLMWGVGSLLAAGLLGLAPWVALLVGAVLAPVDPILASSVVTGPMAERNVPAKVRGLLGVESAGNDALAFPLVLLPLLVLTHPHEPVLRKWLLDIVLWEVGLGGLVGAVGGWLVAHFVLWADRRGLVEQRASMTVALVLAALGGLKLLRLEGIFGAFTAGLLYARMIPEGEREEELHGHEGLERLLTVGVFILVGLMLPWTQWRALSWPEWGFAGLVLLLRRLPVVLGLHRFIPLLRRWRDAGLLGWFGPMGGSTLFYALLAARRTGHQEPWVLGSLVVVLSVLVFTVSTPPLTRKYGRLGGREEAEAEASGSGG